MEETQLNKIRIKRMIIAYAIAIIVLLVYAVFVKTTGWTVVCPVWMMFHIKCPVCGITHFSVDALQLKLGSAIRHNYMAPLIYLVIGEALVEGSIAYIKSGRFWLKASKIRVVLMAIFVAIMLFWTIYRNFCL